MTSSQLPIVHEGTAGRPRYSDAVKKKILLGLRSGMTRRAAAGFAGVHHSTLYDWIAQIPEFADEVTKAEDSAEASFTATLRRAGTGDRADWRAALAWLERRRPSNWREKITVEETTQSLEEGLDEALNSDDVDRRIQDLAEEALRRRSSRASGDAEGAEGSEGSAGEPS